MKKIRNSMIGMLALCASVSPASDGDETSVDFARDIGPVFVKNCVACHNEKKAEGGLDLQSHSGLMRGGDSGAAIEAGKADDGLLLARVRDNDDPMPPDGNSVGAQRLTENEISLLKRWIGAGAPAPQTSTPSNFGWQPLPDSVHPINALATSPDGNYVAFGRGNQAMVMRQTAANGSDQAFALIDPGVNSVLNTSNPNAADTQGAHLDIVQSIAFSPDSQLIATGGYRCVKIWQKRTQPIETLAGAISFPEPPSVVSIAPDGRHVAAAQGSQLEIFDAENARSLRMLKVHASSVASLAWLEGSHELLSSGADGTFVLVDGQSGRIRPLTVEAPIACRHLKHLGSNRFIGINGTHALVELTLHLEPGSIEARPIDGFHDVTAVDVATAAQNVIALGQIDGKCHLVNSVTWEVVKTLETSNPISTLAISPDGKRVATAADNKPAEVWRVEDGTRTATLDRDYELNQKVLTSQRNTTRQESMLARLNAGLTELTKAAEAEEAARAKIQETRDKAIADLETKKMGIETASTEVASAEKALTDAEAAVAEAMKLVETRKAELEAKRKAVQEANTQRDNATMELAKREQALASAVDAKERAAAKVPEMQQSIAGEQQRLTELQTHRDALASDPQAQVRARHVAFVGDGSRVAVADDAARIQLYAAADGATEAVWKTDSKLAGLLITPQGNLTGLSERGTVTTLDLNMPWELKQTIGTFEESPWSDRITALDFSPDGSRLAVGSGPPSRFGEIAIVGVANGEVERNLGQVHSDSVLALRFSPSGRMLASGSADKICRIFDTENGQMRLALEGHTHHVLALSWKDDGVTLATGSADNSVKIWNVETGTQSRTIGGFKKEVTSIAFVGQTDQFVAVDASGAAQLIEATDGKHIRAFAGAEGAILAIGIGSGSHVLFAGGQSGKTWAWKIDDGTKLN